MFRDNSEKFLSGLTKLQKCLEEQTKEKLISEEKNLPFFFFKSLRELFLISYRTITGLVIKTATHVALEDFEDKLFYEKMHKVSTSSGLWDKKLGLLVRKIFSGFLQRDSTLLEKYLEEKWFLFRKSFILLVSFLEIDQFLCRFANFFSHVCQNTDLRVFIKETG